MNINKIESRVNGKYTYTLTHTKVSTEDIGWQDVYGIGISDKHTNIHENDISNDYKGVYSLYELIVEEKLCPEHLYDVIEDFLSENKC